MASRIVREAEEARKEAEEARIAAEEARTAAEEARTAAEEARIAAECRALDAEKQLREQWVRAHKAEAIAAYNDARAHLDRSNFRREARRADEQVKLHTDAVASAAEREKQLMSTIDRLNAVRMLLLYSLPKSCNFSYM